MENLLGIAPELRRMIEDFFGLQSRAAFGDMVLVCEPATLSSSAAAVTAAIAGANGYFERDVEVRLETAAGHIHEWFEGTFAIAGSEVTAGDGTADTVGATVALVKGKGRAKIRYIGTWSKGTKQVETATVVAAAGITGAGNADVIVTAAGMTGSPKTIKVALALNDTAAQAAGKIRAALALDAAVISMFDVSGAGAGVILTRKLAVANDATLNIDINNDTCTGLTDAPASANTTAGVAADKATLTVTGDTLYGAVVAAATSVDTLVA